MRIQWTSPNMLWREGRIISWEGEAPMPHRNTEHLQSHPRLHQQDQIWRIVLVLKVILIVLDLLTRVLHLHHLLVFFKKRSVIHLTHKLDLIKGNAVLLCHSHQRTLISNPVIQHKYSNHSSAEHTSICRRVNWTLLMGRRRMTSWAQLIIWWMILIMKLRCSSWSRT